MYTVLAVTCHPDDLEINCAGTLLKCKQRGDRVVVCHLCSGDLGHMVIPPDELKKIRAKEAQNSAAIGGFEYMYGGFDDLSIYDNNKAARDMVVDVIREVNPDFIITHSPDDYMPDHTATSRLVFEASFTSSVPHYRTAVDKDAKVVPIYYMAPHNGINFNPTEYVDVSDCMDTKIDMLNCHESQVVWLKDHDNIDVAETARAISRFWGLQSGVQYAEGFRQCMVALKITTKRMLP